MTGIFLGHMFEFDESFNQITLNGNISLDTTTVSGGLTVTREASVGNAHLKVGVLQVTTSTTVANGLGASLNFYAENNSGNLVDIGNIRTNIQGITIGAERGVVTISTKSAGVTRTSFIMDNIQSPHFFNTFYFDAGSSTIQTASTNTTLVILGNKNASDSGTDLVFAGEVGRTNGYLATVNNNTSTRFGVRYDGAPDFYASSQGTVGAGGSAANPPTPVGYLPVMISGTEYLMAYFNKS